MRVFCRFFAALAVVAGAAMPARAQQAPCLPVSPTEQVTVTMADGTTARGTLLCLTNEAVRMLREGQTTETPLDQIRRIQTRADPAWDGAVKGAAIPFVMWAIFSHDSESLGWTLRSAAGWAVIGATWDSLQTNKKTIYTGGGRSASIAWRVRF